MASTWNNLKRTIGIAIPASMAVLAIGSGAAWAQTTYSLYGSDTCTQLIQTGIAKSGAKITYYNTGSGQGEKNITGNGSVKQGIAPMSRNFANPYATDTNLAPTSDQVMCLDGAVFATAGSQETNINCSATSGSPTCDKTCDINVNPMAIVLGGYPASCRSSGTWSNSAATTVECADPARVQAILNLERDQSVPQLLHFLRRDDKSGTQDTFREDLNFNRWCNGKSEGNLNASGSNLQNHDLDPIRRLCMNVSGDTTQQPTRCTFYPLDMPSVGHTCYPGQVIPASTTTTSGTITMSDGTTYTNPYYYPIPCTQGFVVALSENDPSVSDITVSIGNRIVTAGGLYMGGAGLAVLKNGASGPNVNTMGYDGDSIRYGLYPMARRLFIQRRQDHAAFIAGDPGRDNEEETLFGWLTTRSNMFTLCTDAGFLSPFSSSDKNCLNDGSNITCGAPFDAGISAPKMNIGAETTACDSSYPCVANGKTKATDGTCGGTDTNCPAIPAMASTYACNMGTKCSSGSCPDADSACSAYASCALPSGMATCK